MKDMCVVLGASDPEATAAERLLRRCSVKMAYAVGPDKLRVHTGNAYQAVAAQWAENSVPVPGPAWDRVTHLFECAPIDGAGAHNLIVIDHHRPGDPGYGKPPEEFLAASSLGQVISLLARLGRLPASWPATAASTPVSAGSIVLLDESWRVAVANTLKAIPNDLVLVAAADHCLEAAYRGLCPAVDPEKLMRWRAASRAAFQGRPIEAVLADIQKARERLCAAVDCDVCSNCGGFRYCFDNCDMEHRSRLPYADLRGESIPELPEAAAREGIPFVADQRDRDGRRKVVLMAAPQYLVRKFMAGGIVPNLVDVYGDPARGFAGGYVQQ